MKKLTLIITALAFGWLPLAASAADNAAPADQAAPAAPADSAKSQADLEKQLEEARAKLQEYARKVADLSMQVNSQAGDAYYYSSSGGGSSKRGFLGVDLSDNSYGDDNQPGVKISSVNQDSPADKAGLKEGDVITGINGTSFKGNGDASPGVKLMRFMKTVKPGDKLAVDYTRDGKAATAKVVAGDARDTYAMNYTHRPVLGIDIGRDDSGNGVAVVAVTPDGPADKAGLHTGDVIVAMNGTSLKPNDDRSSGDQLLAFMDKEHPGDKVKLDYTRDGKSGSTTATVASSGDYSFSFRMPPMPPMPPMAPMAPMPEMPRIYTNWGGFGRGGRWGQMQLTPMNPGLAAYFGTDKGLLVLKAAKDSPLQLQDGDVILDIGGRPLDTPSQAMRVLASYEPGESIKLDIMRKGKPVTLTVSLPKSRRDDGDNTFSLVFPSWGNDDDGSEGR